MLAAAALAAVYAHAEAGWPEEVCGFIVGETVVRCENVLRSRTRFAFAAADLMRAGDARIVYHSHVDAPADFSDEDARAAAPDGVLLWAVDWLVVEVRDGRAVGGRLYRYKNGTFVVSTAFCRR